MMMLGIAAPLSAMAYDYKNGAMFCTSSRPNAILRTVDTGQYAEHRRGTQTGAIVNSWGTSTSAPHTSFYGTGTQGWYAHASILVANVSATCNN